MRLVEDWVILAILSLNYKLTACLLFHTTVGPQELSYSLIHPYNLPIGLTWEVVPVVCTGVVMMYLHGHI